MSFSLCDHPMAKFKKEKLKWGSSKDSLFTARSLLREVFILKIIWQALEERMILVFNWLGGFSIRTEMAKACFDSSRR